MTMKKIYIKPQILQRPLLVERHLLAGSELRNFSNNNVGTYLGRKADNSGWDEEEEEENTGGWFQ